jgi:arginyl-tRNA synthetase
VAKKHGKLVRKAEAALAEGRQKLAALDAGLAQSEADGELSRRVEDHADIRNAVLQETARLHAGDVENTQLWEEFLPKCRQDIERIYDRLGVSFDQELGESFYQDRLVAVVESLAEKGLVRESEGAACVFVEGFETPMIVRKRDGAFLYATTDLATVQYRMETWRPDAILYVVDFRQGEHFDKFFAAARKWGYTEVELKHVRFGTVLGDDGRPFKTRAGDTVGLELLLDEAERRALAVVAESDEAKPDGPEWDQQQREHISRVVGIAALKYADLSQNRDSDYVFSYDKMLALNGNTATYLQYSYARVHGIFARGDVDIDALRRSDAKITLDALPERALAKQILRFSEAIDDTLTDYRPNLLSNYLYELSKTFTAFFDKCPVLKADTDDLRASRLLLCDLTARALKQGLLLLGIGVVEKM